MFDRIGVIAYAAKVASAEAIFEAAVESGASNVESSAEQHEVTCDPDDFSAVRDALTEKFGDPLAAELTWRPQTSVAIDAAKAQTMPQMLDMHGESDHVQRVSANFEPRAGVLGAPTAPAAATRPQ